MSAFTDRANEWCRREMAHDARRGLEIERIRDRFALLKARVRNDNSATFVALSILQRRAHQEGAQLVARCDPRRESYFAQKVAGRI